MKFKLVSINWGSLKAMLNLLQQFKILPSEEKFYTYIETLAQKAHFSTQTLQVILNQETLKGSDLAVVEMTKAKREEIEDILQSMDRTDPVAAQRIEENLIASIKRMMSGGTQTSEE